MMTRLSDYLHVRVVRGTALVFCMHAFLFLSFYSQAFAQQSSSCPCSFADLAAGVNKSVVHISSTRIAKGPGAHSFEFPFGGEGEDPLRDFFEKFFGDRLPRERKESALGSGFVIDQAGFILTNNHVVEEAGNIMVKLATGEELPAKVIGRDPQTDLALIKIDPPNPLPALSLGDSETLRVGDWVIAVGSPFGLVSTVTAGIVSAKYRRIGVGAYDDFIQTDASINPGNSGGPLLNMEGEVVGITTAIFSRSGGNIGIGFAIPSNIAKDLIPQLRKGKVIRGWLGVMIQGITPLLKEKLKLATDSGALVSSVTPGSPAEKGGIRRGDVIVSFDGKPVKEMNDLPYMVATTEIGKRVPVTVIRQGEKVTLEVVIATQKAEEAEEEAPAEAQARPKLGLSLQNVTPEVAKKYGLQEPAGVLVAGVAPGSPAAEAGLTTGDVILEVEQQPVQGAQEFMNRIQKVRPGEAALLLVQRKGNTMYVTLEIPKG